MLITPVPGVNREHLHVTLNSLQQSLVGARNATANSAAERAYRYLDWTHEARRMLRRQIRPSGLEYLVPTRNYDVVLAAAAAQRDVLLAPARDLFGQDGLVPQSSAAGERQLNGLLGMLIDEQTEAFGDARDALGREMQRFQRDATMVVIDTNIYMHHPQKLEDIDLAAELHLGFADIHILVPLVVIDELDKGKRSGGKPGFRAGYAVSYIDRIVQEGGVVRPKDFSNGKQPRGEVTVEVVLDPPGHTRVPNNDDEIVARTADIQTLAGHPIRLVTYDVKMRMRGRHAGLRVDKLEEPVREEKAAPRTR